MPIFQLFASAFNILNAIVWTVAFLALADKKRCGFRFHHGYQQFWIIIYWVGVHHAGSGQHQELACAILGTVLVLGRVYWFIKSRRERLTDGQGEAEVAARENHIIAGCGKFTQSASVAVVAEKDLSHQL